MNEAQFQIVRQWLLVAATVCVAVFYWPWITENLQATKVILICIFALFWLFYGDSVFRKQTDINDIIDRHRWIWIYYVFYFAFVGYWILTTLKESIDPVSRPGMGEWFLLIIGIGIPPWLTAEIERFKAAGDQNNQ